MELKKNQKIEVSNLDLYYSDFKALKNINIKIPQKKLQHLSDRPDVENRRF